MSVLGHQQETKLSYNGIYIVNNRKYQNPLSLASKSFGYHALPHHYPQHALIFKYVSFWNFSLVTRISQVLSLFIAQVQRCQAGKEQRHGAETRATYCRITIFKPIILFYSQFSFFLFFMCSCPLSQLFSVQIRIPVKRGLPSTQQDWYIPPLHADA